MFYEIIDLNNISSHKTSADSAERAIALGMMDGVHLGHQKLIEEVLKFSKANNTISCATTFREPPIKWTAKDKTVELITTLEERLLFLKNYGVEQAIVFDFEETSKLKANEYLNRVLKNELKVKFIVCGANHHFGFKKEGCNDLLKQWGKENNIETKKVEIIKLNEEQKISSSLVRQLLKNGELSQAEKVLGHKFIVQGKSIPGQKVGRKLGFPTINVEYNFDKVLIPRGVYAAYTSFKFDNYSKKYKSAVNLGFAPTANEENPRKQIVLESHLLDFHGTVREDEDVLVELVEFIREEKKFPNLEDLSLQINKDLQQVRALFE